MIRLPLNPAQAVLLFNLVSDAAMRRAAELRDLGYAPNRDPGVKGLTRVRAKLHPKCYDDDETIHLVELDAPDAELFLSVLYREVHSRIERLQALGLPPERDKLVLAMHSTINGVQLRLRSERSDV